MIYVFTGNGKGKTTAALGMGIRAAGAGKKVLMVQFLKPGGSSENKVLGRMKNFKVKSFGREGFGPFIEKDFLLAKEAFDFLKKELRRRKYGLVILDEVNVALHFNLVALDSVLSFLKEHGKKRDLVLTGRYCPRELIEAADLVTECSEVKHYFQKGVKAEKGREY